MEEKILKKTAVFIFVLSAAVCFAVPWFPHLRTAHENMIEDYREYRTKTKAERLNMTGLELMKYNNEQAEGVSFESQIRMELPFGVAGSDLQIEEDLMLQTADIRIPFAGESYFYEYPVLGSADYIDSLTYEREKNYGIVKFAMDRVCEIRTHYDKDYLYIDFLTPKELYDKVVVIDAGSGGNILGITKQGVCEKDINLDILLKLKKIFEDAKDRSVGVYYTRTADVNLDSETRMKFSNLADADLFISICSNSTQSGRMSSINGTQAWYDGTDSEEGKKAKELAQICLEEVTAAAGSSDKGVTALKESYLRNSRAPAAAVAVGFMTNQEELDRLCSGEYQDRIAQGIYYAVLRALKKED